MILVKKRNKVKPLILDLKCEVFRLLDKTYIPIAYKKEIATEVGTKEQRDFIKKIIEKVEKSNFYYENFIKKG